MGEFLRWRENFLIPEMAGEFPISPAICSFLISQMAGELAGELTPHNSSQTDLRVHDSMEKPIKIIKSSQNPIL